MTETTETSEARVDAQEFSRQDSCPTCRGPVTITTPLVWRDNGAGVKYPTNDMVMTSNTADILAALDAAIERADAAIERSLYKGRELSALTGVLAKWVRRDDVDIESQPLLRELTDALCIAHIAHDATTQPAPAGAREEGDDHA